MKSDIDFWIATMGRGILALVLGSAVIVFPNLATTFIWVPLAVGLSVLCLAVYGLIDSLLILGSSTTACSPITKIVLRVQGIVGILVAAAMLSIAYEKVQFEWFFYLIAIQALCTGISEFIVAHYAFTHTESVWDYVAAWIAVLWGAAYLIVWVFFDGQLVARQVEWFITIYLATFGFALAATAVRMLLSDYKPSRMLYPVEAR